MNKKYIFIGIIAIVFIVAMYLYRDTVSLKEMIAYLIGAASSIVSVWNWLDKKDIKNDFKREVGIKYSTYKNKAIRD